MAKFIKLTFPTGNKFLVNPDHIIRVLIGTGDNKSNLIMLDGEYWVKEDFEEIIRLIDHS
jgi:uncharacterized protein YlzI (FlbEa/FlbD family)